MTTRPSDEPIMVETPREYLRRVGTLDDNAIDLADAALAFAALDRPHVALDRYRHHLEALGRDLAVATRRLNPDGDTLGARIKLLNEVIYDRHGYRGDSLNYDDLQNANLMRVIDRRRGLPVSLGILYVHTARAQSWDITGLNFPAHFMVRLEHRGQRAIIDPFNEGTVREVAELREMLKTSHGDEARLSPDHYAPVGSRDILLRLRNNLKLRLCQSGEIAKALAVVESMMLIAPDEPNLWLEVGTLSAKLGNLGAAIAALEKYLADAERDSARHHAASLLQQLRAQLN